MDVLWDTDGPLSAGEVRAALNDALPPPDKPLAATTVLTVLSRLETKGFVSRDRDAWPHRHEATTPRAEHMAELMHEVLGQARNRGAVLARFVGRVTPEEADELRNLLESR